MRAGGELRKLWSAGDDLSALRHLALCLFGLICAIGLPGCSRGTDVRATQLSDSRVSAANLDPNTGTSASPRVASEGDVIPKGGGSYKLGSPYQVSGRWYVPREEPNYDATGVASWYGSDFHGRKTANGEIFDMNALTAAHPTLPIPSYAYVTNLDNNRTVLVRINDRGPYAHDRIIDLSRQTARAIGSEGKGLVNVRVRHAGRAPLNGDDHRERQHLAAQPWWRGQPELAAIDTRASWTPLQNLQSLPPPQPFATTSQPTASNGWSPLAHRANRSGLGAR